MEPFPSPLPFGPYTIHAKIAQGGMSDVFLGTSAQKELMGQFLAIKKLLPHLNSNKPFVNLLIHEAKIGVLLSHPCIVNVIDLGCVQTDFFLAMEYIHGKSLDVILTMIKEGKSPALSVELASYITSEILRALTFAHQLKDTKDRDLNIIHRDISPGNILVSYLGEVKLADFGIATAENRLQPNFSNAAMGKIAYISPEQAVNDPVTKASDIYSLAVVYFQMLTGRLPFEGTSATEVFKKVVDGRLSETVHKAGNLPKGLRALLQRSLDRSSKNRPQSCPELFNTLQEILHNEYKIDFNSKSSRNYFRKKLSEYMRSAFQNEIAREIQLTQSALIQPKPSGRQAIADRNSSREVIAESTVFQSDLTDEATRHYPLTEAERSQILDGLPPKDVIEQGLNAFVQEATQAAFDVSATSISEDLSSAIRSISVEDKFKNLKITKDEKEALKDRQPQLEIQDAQALEKFEITTFTGSRAQNPELVGNLEKLQPAPARSSFRTEKTKPAVLINETARISHITNRKTSFDLKKMSFVFQKAYEFKRYAIMGAIGLVVLTLGVIIALELSKPSYPWKGHWTESQKVFVQVLGEASQEQLQHLTTAINDLSLSPNLRQLEEFFNREFARYTGSTKNILQIEISNYPVVLMDGLTKQTNIVSLLKQDSLFRFFSERGVISKGNSDATVYLYYLPVSSEKEDLDLPEEFLGERKSKEGVIIESAQLSRRDTMIFSLAREIAKIYGATDKVDLTSRMPIFPAAYIEPKANPLFPQRKAELMGQFIPINALQKKSASNFEELAIGPQTAHELGWISEKARARLVK